MIDLKDYTVDFDALDYVRVRGSDYTYKGWLVAVFEKRGGGLRCVVEDVHGRLAFHLPSEVGFLPTREEAIK